MLVITHYFSFLVPIRRLFHFLQQIKLFHRFLQQLNLILPMLFSIHHAVSHHALLLSPDPSTLNQSIQLFFLSLAVHFAAIDTTTSINPNNSHLALAFLRTYNWLLVNCVLLLEAELDAAGLAQEVLEVLEFAVDGEGAVAQEAFDAIVVHLLAVLFEGHVA